MTAFGGFVCVQHRHIRIRKEGDVTAMIGNSDDTRTRYYSYNTAIPSPKVPSIIQQNDWACKSHVNFQ